MSLDEQREAWEELGQQDPYWAILADPVRRNGGWDVEAFLATGVQEVAGLAARMADLGFTPRGASLDFGCGVGRVTRALAAVFEEVVGVDVAQAMIDRGAILNADIASVTFVRNGAPDLRILGDRRFAFVYSNLVLQHMVSRRLIEGYVAEFLRLLEADGMLAFQLPASIPLRYRIQPRRRLYALLRGLRVPAAVLQARLGMYPMAMTAMVEEDVIELVRRNGGEVRAIDRGRIEEFAIDSNLYWVTRRPGSNA